MATCFRCGEQFYPPILCPECEDLCECGDTLDELGCCPTCDGDDDDEEDDCDWIDDDD